MVLWGIARRVPSLWRWRSPLIGLDVQARGTGTAHMRPLTVRPPRDHDSPRQRTRCVRSGSESLKVDRDLPHAARWRDGPAPFRDPAAARWHAFSSSRK